MPHRSMDLIRHHRWLAVALAVGLVATIWVGMRGAGVNDDTPGRAPVVAEPPQILPSPTPPGDAPLESKQEPPQEERSRDADDEPPPLEEMRTQTRLFGTAHVRAYYEGRDFLGVQIFDVAPGSFWDLVGLHNGDLILEANGQLIDTPEASVGLLNALSRKPVLVLTVRDLAGAERTFEYRAPY